MPFTRFFFSALNFDFVLLLDTMHNNDHRHRANISKSNDSHKMSLSFNLLCNCLFLSVF